MNDPRDLPLEDRLRAHFADRAAREGMPPVASVPTAPPQPHAPPWWRRPTLLVAAAGLLVLTGVATAVAVTGDGGEDVGVGGSDTTTTATTEAPTTTVPATSSSTTTSTTATTAPPPSSSDLAVVVAPDGILGWWDGSAWIRGDSGAAPPVIGGETYRLVQLGGGGTAVGGAPEPGCELIEPRPDVVDLGVGRSEDRLATPPIGLYGVDDPHPRPVTELDPAAYAGIAVELRSARGLAGDGSVSAIRADLGGNGTDEVLLTVERLSDQRTLFAAEGDHSIVVLRQVIDGQVHTTVLHDSIGRARDDGPPFVEFARVAAVADLNGDGRMEVVLQRTHYEGASTEVWESDPGGGVRPILSVGCGA